MVIPIVYDRPEEEGIEVSLDLENGMAINLFISDEDALEMINIIQNKLNGRWKK